jgi:hypothetical protein
LGETERITPFVGEEGEEDVENLGEERGGYGRPLDELQAAIDYAAIERLLRESLLGV